MAWNFHGVNKVVTLVLKYCYQGECTLGSRLCSRGKLHCTRASIKEGASFSPSSVKKTWVIPSQKCLGWHCLSAISPFKNFEHPVLENYWDNITCYCLVEKKSNVFGSTKIWHVSKSLFSFWITTYLNDKNVKVR